MNKYIGLFSTVFVLMLFLAGPPGVQADERLKGIACRSVHLQFPAPAGLAYYNEVTVDQSSEGTYFCVCGFNQGYFGLQELANGKKLIIFSVWDPGQQNDPNAVHPEDRVKLRYQGEGVRVGRFGNEGTGGQSFFDFPWKTGQTYRFLVTARPDSERTAYAAYFYLPDAQRWTHLVTFSTKTDKKAIGGYYAFIEDFRRNRVSATKEREARFGNGWVQTDKKDWVALNRARFTADRNPVTNIDAGTTDNQFFLATGGKTANTHTPLGQPLERPAIAGAKPPDLSQLPADPSPPKD
ncbi:MAG: DUF3472 domain-containing protein [Isosphaeraceae bacterium]